MVFLRYSNWFENETSVTLEGFSEAYSEPCQTSKMEVFTKIVSSFLLLTIFTKSSILDVWQDFEQASSPSNDLQKKLHLRCLAWSWIHLSVIFTRLLPICLLNLINIFHHISSNTVFCAILYCWLLSMDGVQLPQGYRAITRRQFTFYH